MNASPSTAPLPDTRNNRRAWIVFWIASVAVFLVSLDTTMLYSVFSSLERGFQGADAADLSWVLNGYTLVYAAMLIPAGGFSDAYGRKRIFLIGVALFIAASAACGMATNVPILVTSRVVQALGAALLTPASLSLVLAAFPLEQGALTVSLWGAVGGFAAAIGPSLGAYFAQTLSWRWAFFINVPIGLAALFFGLKYMKPIQHIVKQVPKRRIDLVGMVLLIAAVGALALGLTELTSPSWSRGDIFEVWAASAASLLAFVLWARNVTAPLIDLSLFRNGSYNAVNLATFTFGIAFAMMFFAFFFYMTQIWHFDQIHAGLAIVPGPLTVIPVAIISGRLAGRYGHRRFLVAGALLYALTGLWFYLVPGTSPAYFSQWLPGLFMSGLSVGLVMPSLSGAAVARLPAEHYAIGSAVNQATRQIGSVIGVALIVMLLGNGVVTRTAFNTVYGAHVALALITAVLCAFVQTRRAST